MLSLQIGVNDTEIEILYKLLKNSKKFKGPGGKVFFGLQNKDFQDSVGKWKNGKKIFSDYKYRLLELKTIYKIKPKKAHSPYGLTPIGICYLAKYVDDLTYSDVKEMIEYLENYCKVRIPFKELVNVIEEDDIVSSFQHNCDIIRITKNEVVFNIDEIPSLSFVLQKYNLDSPELFGKLSKFLLHGLCFSIIDYYHNRMNNAIKHIKLKHTQVSIDTYKQEKEIVKKIWLKIPLKIFVYSSYISEAINHLLLKQMTIHTHYDDWEIKKTGDPKGLSMCDCFS